jgi:hypothetical protein
MEDVNRAVIGRRRSSPPDTKPDIEQVRMIG